MREFYVGARSYKAKTPMDVVHSRNISMIPILQSVVRLKTLYNERWQILTDNRAVTMILGAGSGAVETHEYITKLLKKRLLIPSMAAVPVAAVSPITKPVATLCRLPRFVTCPGKTVSSWKGRLLPMAEEVGRSKQDKKEAKTDSDGFMEVPENAELPFE